MGDEELRGSLSKTVYHSQQHWVLLDRRVYEGETEMLDDGLAKSDVSRSSSSVSGQLQREER